MMRYFCDFCGAAADRGEKLVSLARHRVIRRPASWELDDEAFATLGSEAIFHESCLLNNSRAVLERLYEGEIVVPPRKRRADIIG
jgi:hypothetical protein